MTSSVTGSSDQYAATATPDQSVETLDGVAALTHLLWERGQLTFGQVEAVPAAALAALYSDLVAPALAALEEQVRRRIDDAGHPRWETVTTAHADPPAEPPPPFAADPPDRSPAR